MNLNRNQEQHNEDDPVTGQVRRLRALKKYPRDHDGRPGDRELIRIAQKFVQSQENGWNLDIGGFTRLVDRMLEEWEECPSPSQLKTLIANICMVARKDDNMRRWRDEFRSEVHRCLLALEQLGDCRARQNWEDYLRYAEENHPDIVRDERVRMGLKAAPRSPVLPFVPFTPLKTAPNEMTSAHALMGGIMQTLNGRNTDADYARLRRNGIRDALEATANPVRGETPEANASRQFWADHLAWAEREHPDEVAQLRAEPL
jgi:hypothetical protein